MSPVDFGDLTFGADTFGGITTTPSGIAYTVEIDFTTALMETPTAWVDVTPWVRNFTTRRGRSHELGKMQAGEATVTLDNRDRRFDPSMSGTATTGGTGTGTFGEPGKTFGDAGFFGGFSGVSDPTAVGPYWPNVVPMRHVRITVTTPNGVYRLFTGFIDDWGQQWSGPHAPTMGDATCEVHAVDALAVLNLIDITSYPAEVLTDGPVGYWPMGEPSPSGSLADLGSGGQPMVSKENDPANLRSGMVAGPLLGGAMAIDYIGSTAAAWATDAAPDDYLIKGDATVEAWVYLPVGYAGSVRPVVIRTGTSERAAFYVDAVGNPAVVTVDANDAERIAQGTAPISTGTWHHLAWVRRGTLMTFYTDGAPNGATESPPVAYKSGAINVLASFAPATNCRIAHVAMYGQPLSSDRIQAHYAARLGEITSQRVDSAISTVLDVVGWNGGRSLTPSGYICQAHLPEPNALTELLMLAEDTDAGMMFADGSGALVFRSSDDLRKDLTPSAAWGDSTAELRYSGLTLRYDDQDLYTEVRVSGRDLPDAVASVSSATYGPRTLQNSGGVLGDQNQLQDRATGLLGRYSTPSLRPETLLAVDSPSQARADEMFASEIGRRVTVTRRPPGGGSPMVLESVIEGVAHSPVEALTQMRTTLNLVPVLDPAPWILEDATHGVLDSTTTLGW